MESNELRIGNLVLNTDFNTVTEIKEGWQIDSCDVYYEPIPLTEEWLLKFGFEKKENGLFTKKIEYIYNSLKYCDDYKIWIYYNDDNDAACNAIADLNYVHELQNLYHCLCGKELQINTTKTTK